MIVVFEIKVGNIMNQMIEIMIFVSNEVFKEGFEKIIVVVNDVFVFQKEIMDVVIEFVIVVGKGIEMVNVNVVVYVKFVMEEGVVVIKVVVFVKFVQEIFEIQFEYVKFFMDNYLVELNKMFEFFFDLFKIFFKLLNDCVLVVVDLV